MPNRVMNKPFYLKPPWNILFEIHRLQTIYPWDVKISFLLPSFLEEMEKRKNIDFRASGIALDSSATIYLLKSKLLLKLEEPPAAPSVRSEFIPPPLILPLRYELTSTTIHHLLKALDEALRGEKLIPIRQRLEPVLPPPPEIVPTVSVYLMEIEKEIERLYQNMLQLSKDGLLITFSKITSDLDKLEKIRIFIILLFMAQREMVSLWQEENFGEIFITLAGG